MPGIARVCACPRFSFILARAFIANSCSVGRGRLCCYRSFIPWHRPRPLCSWLIMAPEAFAPAFAFACSRLSDSEPLQAAPDVAALAALACSRSASIKHPFGVFLSCSCSFLQKYLLFRLFYTQKRTKCTLFCTFFEKYLVVSNKSSNFAPQSKIIDSPTEGGTLAKSLIKAKL